MITKRNKLHFFLGMLTAGLITMYSNCSTSSGGDAGGGGVTTQSVHVYPVDYTTPPAPGNTPKASIPQINDANVMKVTVDGGCGYANEPCVSVTICTPGTTSCVTIPNILLDSGSYGLRVFSQVIGNLQLSPMSSSKGGALAECVTYGDTTSDWGPLRRADVYLGTEVASGVPIQIIDSTYAGIPSGCGKPDVDPAYTHFYGILGVGLFAQDCGSDCLTSASNDQYFSCSNGSCTGVAVALGEQVSNPVPFMNQDNNGVVIELPAVPVGGSPSADGFVVFGIGTETNNQPTGNEKTFIADSDGNIQTTFSPYSQTTAMTAFIDSGSNALVFPSPSAPQTQIPQCSGSIAASQFFCPSSELSYAANMKGQGPNTSSETVSFSIGNADNYLSSSNSNWAFSDIGASLTSLNSSVATDFDWGLPFFYGKNVYVGVEYGSSSLGQGMYWSY